MIKKPEDLRNARVENLIDGQGPVNMIHLLEKEEFNDKGRMYARVLLEPGSSIGYHIHNGEQESYYILKGQGLYDDNGREVIVNQGDLTLCKDGEGHSIKNDGKEDLEFIALITNV